MARGLKGSGGSVEEGKAETSLWSFWRFYSEKCTAGIT